MFELEKNIEVLRLFQYFFSSISDVFSKGMTSPYATQMRRDKTPFWTRHPHSHFVSVFRPGARMIQVSCNIRPHIKCLYRMDQTEGLPS